MAIGLVAQVDQGVDLADSAILDEWTVPFGDWIDQSVTWVDQNLGSLLDAINAPFEYLLDVVLKDGIWFIPGLESISWIWVVLGFFLIGWLVRSIKVGLFVALALTFCGILGPAYWVETARTIGFIVVAVFFCTLIGIPIGVLCGRFDPFWTVVRPILDAMQVVHSFVYMLPFIYFFGIGPVSATMVTMVFALPPLIRLTNLGIRQVPDDVVEASRAFGAPELRVLVDVQLPLARPAIMTGLNQTLLLSISMLGIAAIMGGGGLGRLLFQAINNQDVAQSASAGLAFFLVAVVLDRISQSEGVGSGGLLQRIHRAWANLRTPEELLPEPEVAALVDEPVVDEPVGGGGWIAGLAPGERLGLPVATAGSVLALISLVLPWGQDSGLISGHARSDDLDLAGQSFNGVEASGGSWFGLALGALALFVLLASILRRLRPTDGSRFLSADGITVAGLGMVGAALAYALASPSPVAVDYSHGLGVWVAVLGALLSVGGGMVALRQAPYSAKRPQSSALAWPRFAGAAIALLIVVASVFSGWVFDQRGGIGGAIPPEIQEQIDELRAQAEDDPSVASANANRVQSLLNQARQSALLIHDGFDADSFQLGPLALVLGLLGLAATVPASGLIGNGDEVWRWRWSTLVAGSGVALMVLATGLIGSTTRVRESQFTTGVGVLLLLTAGFFMLGSARGMLTVFERRKVYADDIAITKGVIEPEGSTDELLVQAGA